MAKRARMNKYSRRTSHSRRPSRGWIVALVIAVFIMLCFAISIPIGLALGERADEEESLPRFELPVEDYYSGEKQVRRVNARPYQLGYSVAPYISSGISDLSLCLRDTDGFIAYNSQVNVSFGDEIKKGSRRLSEAVDFVHEGGGYLCSYIYLQSLSIEDEYLREIYKAYEIALINEAAESGVDEIMLIGVEPNEKNIDEIVRFVSDAAIAAGKSPLGVLLKPEVFARLVEHDYTAARIRSVCDFVALDMRHLPENAAEGGEESLLFKALGENDDYIRTYSMRVVLSDKNASLYDAARGFGVESIQIIE